MARKAPAVQEEISPNLIPMVDIMFLLLLFFMLSADMGQRELEDVMLPHALTVKEDKATKNKDDAGRLTINIFHKYANEVNCSVYKAGQVCYEESHWRVGIKGHDYSDPVRLGKRIKDEADKKEWHTDKEHPDISELKVMIRGDKSAPYGAVQKSMNMCADAGIYKIECGAASPQAEKKKG